MAIISFFQYWRFPTNISGTKSKEKTIIILWNLCVGRATHIFWYSYNNGSYAKNYWDMFAAQNLWNRALACWWERQPNSSLHNWLSFLVEIGNLEKFMYFYGPIDVLLITDLAIFASIARELTCGLWKREEVNCTTDLY